MVRDRLKQRFSVSVMPEKGTRRLFFWDKKHDRPCGHLEVTTRARPRLHAGVTFDGEGCAVLSLCAGLSLHVGVPIPRALPERLRWNRERWGVDLTLNADDEPVPTLRASAYMAYRDGWASEQESWPLRRRLSEGYGVAEQIDLTDKLLGPIEQETEVLAPRGMAELKLPEGWYSVLGEVSRARYRRRGALGLWTSWRYYADFSMPQGVPTVGRRGEDALYGSHFFLGDRFDHHDRVAAAARALALRIVTDRFKYGGHEWKPRDGWPRHCRPYRYVPPPAPPEQNVRMWAASGQPVWYMEPRRTRVLLSDLRFGLGLQRRYAGSADVTILQHLVLCASLLQENLCALRPDGDPNIRTILAHAVLHDAHEAYVQDITAGLKSLLPEYRRIEAEWERHVLGAFGLTPPTGPLAALIKRYDLIALRAECWHTGHPAYDAVCGQLGEGGPSDVEIEITRRVMSMTEQELWTEFLSFVHLDDLDPGFRKSLTQEKK